MSLIKQTETVGTFYASLPFPEQKKHRDAPKEIREFQLSLFFASFVLWRRDDLCSESASVTLWFPLEVGKICKLNGTGASKFKVQKPRKLENICVRQTLEFLFLVV